MTTDIYIILSLIISALVSSQAIPKVIRVSHSLKLFDQPNARSAAKHVVPTLGGIAIFLGLVFGITLSADDYILPNLRFILAAIIIMFFIGLKDDILNISPWKKISAQVISSLLIILFAGYRFTSLHGFLGIYEIPFAASLLLTIFVIIVFINAFNLIDGIDGLASGLSMFACLVFGGWFYLSGHYEFTILAASLFGALGGFFFFNVYGTKHKIFMGDTGSLVLGLVMAVLVIQFNEMNIDQSQPFAVASAPAVSFGILIYPLLDVIRVFTIRILQGRSPFSPDKNHIHHRLLALGFSHKSATFTIIAVNALFVIPVFALQQIGVLYLMIFILLLSGILAIIPGTIINSKNLIKKDDPTQQVVFLTPKLLRSARPFINNPPAEMSYKLKRIKAQLERISFR